MSSTEGAITISCYYNPCGWKSRLSNYLKFRSSLAPHIPHRTVELSIGGAPYQLSEDCMRLSSSSWMWHKERLLNILARKLLAEGYRKIIWCDADVEFDNPHWFEETAEKLDHYKIVQPFAECSYEGGWSQKGTAALHAEDPRAAASGASGHPGFALGMQRRVWELGLYEYGFRGAGDTIFMKTALIRDPVTLDNALSPYLCRVLQGSSFREWRNAINRLIDPSKDCSYASGHVRHFWGGSMPNRGYGARYRESLLSRVRIGVDIMSVPGCPLEWSSPLGRLAEAEFKRYLTSRREDDPEPS